MSTRSREPFGSTLLETASERISTLLENPTIGPLQTTVKVAMSAASREDTKMKTVRLWGAILATMASIAVMSIRPFNFHRELPMSAQTIQARQAFSTDPTPENEAILMKRVHADVEYNDRHEANAYLLISLSIIAMIWVLYWLVCRRVGDELKIT